MWPRNVIVDKPSQSDRQRISCYRDFDLLDSEQDRHVSPSVYPEYVQNQLESAASASSVYFRRKYFQNKLAWTHLKKNFYYKKISESIPKEKNILDASRHDFCGLISGCIHVCCDEVKPISHSREILPQTAPRPLLRFQKFFIPVSGCKLQVSSFRLKVTSYRSQVTGHIKHRL